MYQEKFAKGDRLYNSPLFEMRRILNESEKEARREATEAIDLSDLFNQPWPAIRLTNLTLTTRLNKKQPE